MVRFSMFLDRTLDAEIFRSGLVMYLILWLTLVMPAAGLCDINEGSATSEDRCKSPTSGNLSLSVLFKVSKGFALYRPNTQTVDQ